MKTQGAPYRVWGDNLEARRVQQMNNACGCRSRCPAR